MSPPPPDRAYGMGRGKVFPAADAASLLHPLRRFLQSPSKLARSLRLSAGDRLLEIGSGPGYFTPDLAAVVPSGGVVAFDLQREMLALASGRMAGSAHVTFAQGDATALPFVAGSFDAVLIATVLGEVPSIDDCLREVRRVLRPGGVLSVAETRRDSDFLPLARLRPMVEAMPFELLDRAGLRWQYVARFRAV
jgi:ubiquinone/menaquinone biosynthesis C-methylase UbiE